MRLIEFIQNIIALKFLQGSPNKLQLLGQKIVTFLEGDAIQHLLAGLFRMKSFVDVLLPG